MSAQLVNLTGVGGRNRWQAADASRDSIDSLAVKLDPARICSRGTRLELLSRVIEVQVIPRLITVLEVSDMCAAPAVSPSGRTHDSREVVELASLVMGFDVDAACVFVEEMQAQGVSLDSLYLDLLTPTARRLGELWTADLCDFTQVTTGLWRLQRLMHELSPAFQAQLDRRAHGRWALLTPVPGDQHSFGLSMVAEFFRREGWNVHSGPLESMAELARTVRSDWFSVAGISAGSAGMLDAVSACIQTIRGSSCNPNIKVLVGGPIFLEQPDLVSRVGADATAQDGQEAVRRADAMLAEETARG